MDYLENSFLLLLLLLLFCFIFIFLFFFSKIFLGLNILLTWFEKIIE